MTFEILGIAHGPPRRNPSVTLTDFFFSPHLEHSFSFYNYTGNFVAIADSLIDGAIWNFIASRLVEKLIAYGPGTHVIHTNRMPLPVLSFPRSELEAVLLRAYLCT